MRVVPYRNTSRALGKLWDVRGRKVQQQTMGDPAAALDIARTIPTQPFQAKSELA
jgi:hypothetical protein